MYSNIEIRAEKDLYKIQKGKIINFGKYKRSLITYKILADEPKYRYYRKWLLKRDENEINGELLELYIFVKSRVNGLKPKERLHMRRTITYDILDSDTDSDCLIIFSDEE